MKGIDTNSAEMLKNETPKTAPLQTINAGHTIKRFRRITWNFSRFSRR